LKLLSWRVNRRSTKLHSFTLGWRYVSIDLIKIIAHYISGGCHPGSIQGPRRLCLAPFHHCTVHEHKSGIRHLKQLLRRAGMEDGRGGGEVSCPQHLPHHLQLTSATHPTSLAPGSLKQPIPQPIPFPCQALSLKGIHITMSHLPIMSKIIPCITACERNKDIPTLL